MRTLRTFYFKFLQLPIWHRAKLFIALPICLSAISIDLRHVEQVLVQGRQGGHSCNCNNKSNKSLYKSWPQPQLTRENLKARVGEAFSASAAGTRPLARKGISLGILSVYFVSTYQQQRWLNRSFDLPSAGSNNSHFKHLVTENTRFCPKMYFYFSLIFHKTYI